MTVNPLSTGSNVAARSWLRASASVAAQNSSRSDGTGRSGAYARSSGSGRSNCGTGTYCGSVSRMYSASGARHTKYPTNLG